MAKLASKQKKTSLNFNPAAAASTTQLCLLAEPDQPKASVKPAPYWLGRYLVEIKHHDCRWRLCPALPELLAYELLDLLKQAGVSFNLTEEGCPVAAAQIHAIVEDWISGGR